MCEGELICPSADLIRSRTKIKKSPHEYSTERKNLKFDSPHSIFIFGASTQQSTAEAKRGTHNKKKVPVTYTMGRYRSRQWDLVNTEELTTAMETEGHIQNISQLVFLFARLNYDPTRSA